MERAAQGITGWVGTTNKDSSEDHAIANGLAVYTANPADFAGIDGLEVIAVPVPAG